MKTGISVLFVLCVLISVSHCFPAEDAKPTADEKFECVCVKNDKCNVSDEVLQNKDGEIVKETAVK